VLIHSYSADRRRKCFCVQRDQAAEEPAQIGDEIFWHSATRLHSFLAASFPRSGSRQRIVVGDDH
jgi:hypothetical protein